MAVAEGINVETLYIMFVLAIMVEAVLLLGIMKGYVIAANQASLLNVVGNLAFAFTVAGGEKEAYLSVNLPSGGGGIIETLVENSPAALGFYSDILKSGFPHLFSLNVTKYGVGEIVKTEKGSSSYVLTYYKKFKPKMKIARKNEKIKVEVER